MIGRLTGQLVAKQPPQIIVDVGGVGYEVLVPLGTLGRAPGDSEGRVTLTVVTHVREDAITLFGFANEGERAAFRLLTGVTGVGPRIAVGILSGLSLHELVGAVLKGDAKRLQTVNGIGKKLADRLVLELKDKIQQGAITLGPTPPGAASPGLSAAASPPSAAPSSGPAATLVMTLVRLGFKQSECERVAAELGPRLDEPLDVLVREALKQLTR